METTPPQIQATTNLGVTSYEMSLSINLAQRAFNQLLKTCLSHHDLTIPKWAILGRLYASPERLRPSSLATTLCIKPPYITLQLAELEADGLIALCKMPDDERGKFVTITQKGNELVMFVESQLEACLQDQLGSLRSDALKTYFATSDYIAQNVKHH